MTDTEDDYEIAMVECDTSPRPRHRERQAQFERRMYDLERETYGAPTSLITDQQIDALVTRISLAVVDAVMVKVRKDAAEAVRESIRDAFGQLSFVVGKVLN